MAAGGYDMVEGLFAGTREMLMNVLPPSRDPDLRAMDEHCQVSSTCLATPGSLPTFPSNQPIYNPPPLPAVPGASLPLRFCSASGKRYRG